MHMPEAEAVMQYPNQDRCRLKQSGLNVTPVPVERPRRNWKAATLEFIAEQSSETGAYHGHLLSRARVALQEDKWILA